MPSNRPEDTSAARFTTTSWTVVAQARDGSVPAARQALTELCQAYWYPMYAFLRRRGHSPDQAEDLTQGFFADLLARDSLKAIDPTKGKFRSFLLASLQHFLSNRRDWDQRHKRGARSPTCQSIFGTRKVVTSASPRTRRHPSACSNGGGR